MEVQFSLWAKINAVTNTDFLFLSIYLFIYLMQHFKRILKTVQCTH